MANRTPRKKLPYINLVIEIPFIKIYTGIMYMNYGTLAREWVSLYLKIWKWETSFKLYSPDREMSYGVPVFNNLLKELTTRLGHEDTDKYVEIITEFIEEHKE